ncbi:MAG TPA: hypothetical protein VND99_03680 [Candidatus Acidoferrales bacterium]|nr:hypothetical protein [Candidatus Acidoferrales bacterium]
MKWNKISNWRTIHIILFFIFLCLLIGTEITVGKYLVTHKKAEVKGIAITPIPKIPPSDSPSISPTDTPTVQSYHENTSISTATTKYLNGGWYPVGPNGQSEQYVNGQFITPQQGSSSTSQQDGNSSSEGTDNTNEGTYQPVAMPTPIPTTALYSCEVDGQTFQLTQDQCSQQQTQQSQQTASDNYNICMQDASLQVYESQCAFSGNPSQCDAQAAQEVQQAQAQCNSEYSH